MNPIKSWINNWKEYRFERRTARAEDLDPAAEHDILLLQRRGFLRARGTGQSITRIHGEVENRIGKSLRVVINPGIFFVARGNFQNMVTREQYSFTLDSGSKRSVTIDATCINAGRPIPGESDRFYGLRQVPEDIRRFLEAARYADPMTVQAGVWALTDGYSGRTVQDHLRMQDQYGNVREAVSDDNIAEAKRILRELGISNPL